MVGFIQPETTQCYEHC